MPYLRATITITAGFQVRHTDKESAVLAREQEDQIRQDVPKAVLELIELAKKDGTITWTVVPAQDPSTQSTNISEGTK